MTYGSKRSLYEITCGSVGFAGGTALGAMGTLVAGSILCLGGGCVGPGAFSILGGGGFLECVSCVSVVASGAVLGGGPCDAAVDPIGVHGGAP